MNSDRVVIEVSGGPTDPVMRPLTLTVSTVPEPATWGLAAVALGILLRCRKRSVTAP